MSSVWSVRGVPPELRRSIVEAASREGIPVAEWLTRAISPSLVNGAKQRPSAPLGADASDTTVDELLARIDGCLAELQNLCRPGH